MIMMIYSFCYPIITELEGPRTGVTGNANFCLYSALWWKEAKLFKDLKIISNKLNLI